ncbi:PadR family transcriptional regulator [Candidatus Bathyarchaeota archaeon]|nr:PadR family transcriptional regulator [Candidatus Bathyarchaeota archaeon]
MINMFDHGNNIQNRLHHREMKKWMRHTAMVPKGFIRTHVLEALSQKPMSGSELMESIENHTGGLWKPSPGSIYPLLSWLQDNQYIKELPVENGLKRYELTESGKTLLEEQKKIRKKFREEVGFLPAPFFDTLLTKIPPEKTAEIRNSMRQLAIVFFKLSSALQENFSEEALNESLSVITEASRKFEEISKKLKGDIHE